MFPNRPSKWTLGTVAIATLAAAVTIGAAQSTRTTKGRTRALIGDGDWNYWSSAPDMFSIPAGNVGIGTATPATRLEVAGQVFSNSGGFVFPDGTVQTTAASPVPYAQVWTVAQAGGDFTTITAALAACVLPSASNRYLIRVMPGTYAESPVCQSWVSLQGAGKYASEITGQVAAASDCVIAGFEIGDGIVCPGVSPTITDNRIHGSGDGIWIGGGGKPWIQRNEITDCAGFGVHCDGWGTDAWIIANKIERNQAGGVRCRDSSPTISNNQILSNEQFGIFLIGALGQPAEPTIDDNVIGRTAPGGGGIGIFMVDYAEPRIISNDIWINDVGIVIAPNTQPSVIGNNINYNTTFGIQCFSSGASKPVVLKGNHIHSNPLAGIDIASASPIVTHNNVHHNDPAGINPDIQYVGPPFPSISLNVFDRIAVQGSGATGSYNVDTIGNPINP